MEIALNDISLALFTTLGSVGAGAFLTIFIATFKEYFKQDQLQKIDRLTLVPILFSLVGLLISFTHLANPANAMAVLNTVGTTPLANEVVAFGVFLVFAIIYWIVGIAGGLKSLAIRRVLCGLVTLSGLAAVIFMGLAYAIPAIPTWDNPRTTVQLIGVYWFAGVILGMLICSLAERETRQVHSAEMTCKIIMLIGAVLLFSSTVIIFMAASAAISPIINVQANSASLTGIFIISLILIVIAAACAFLAKGPKRVPLITSAFVMALVGSYLARMIFYGTQIGLGL